MTQLIPAGIISLVILAAYLTGYTYVHGLPPWLKRLLRRDNEGRGTLPEGGEAPREGE
jgi:hypothetical protein